MNTKDKLKEIKQSFRLFMNGATSSSMRKKGLNYKINWGVPLPILQQNAEKYGKDYELAIELWKDDIRECKIMATYIMPAQMMKREQVDKWMETVRNQELAELISFNLLKNLAFSQTLAFDYISSKDNIYQICGYQLLASLFVDGHIPNDLLIDKFLTLIQGVLKEGELNVQHSAFNSINKFCDLGEKYRSLVVKALPELDFL